MLAVSNNSATVNFRLGVGLFFISESPISRARFLHHKKGVDLVAWRNRDGTRKNPLNL